MSAKKRQKVKKVQKIVPAGSKAQRCVLVGTYKKEQNQLKWIGKRHLYNYPLSAEEAQQPTDGWGNVKELWLYSGPKDRRHIYAAEFVGIKSRKEFLAEHPDYHKGKGKGHGDYYAVFSVRHKYQPTLDESVVVVRAADFKRTPKVAQAVRMYQAGGELGCLLDYLPAELAPLTRDQLRVFEAALQLDSFATLFPVTNYLQDSTWDEDDGHKYTVVDLFSGAGGFEIGFEEAGFKIIFSTDFDAECERVHLKNRPKIPFLRVDIHDLEAGTLKKFVPGDLDVLVGGPPCQGFSTIGKRISSDPKKRAQKDPRNTLFKEYIRVLKTLSPKFFLMENVVGLMTREKGAIFDEIKKTFADTGYRFNYVVLNAADYGVPQIRKRIFFYGSRVDVDITPPRPTHSEAGGNGTQKWRTVGEVITDLATLPDDESFNHVALKHGEINIRRYQMIPEGGRMPEGKLPPELYRKNFGNTFKRLARDRPSLTMVPGHNAFPIHPWLHRSLTVREAARIQTFPDDYILVGGRQHQCTQVGNAVPPLFAKAWALQIKTALRAYYAEKK